MQKSAFVSKGSRPGTPQPATPTMEFTVVALHQAGGLQGGGQQGGGGKHPHAHAGFGVAPRLSFAAGLLRWGQESYEGRWLVVRGAPLPEGFYWCGSPSKPAGGSSKGEHGHNDEAGAQARSAGGTFSIRLTPLHGLPGQGFTIHAHNDRMWQPGLGLVGNDAAEFWERWEAAGRSTRPWRLRFAHNNGTGKA